VLLTNVLETNFVMCVVVHLSILNKNLTLIKLVVMNVKPIRSLMIMSNYGANVLIKRLNQKFIAIAKINLKIK